MMYNLVAATAPDQRRVFKILHKFAIDQHVDEIHYLHLRGVEFIELVTGPYPDVFPRTFSANTLYQLGYPARFADAADRRRTAKYPGEGSACRSDRQ